TDRGLEDHLCAAGLSRCDVGTIEWHDMGCHMCGAMMEVHGSPRLQDHCARLRPTEITSEHLQAHVHASAGGECSWIRQPVAPSDGALFDPWKAQRATFPGMSHVDGPILGMDAAHPYRHAGWKDRDVVPAANAPREYRTGDDSPM